MSPSNKIVSNVNKEEKDITRINTSKNLFILN